MPRKPTLVDQAREWADACASAGIKGNRREMRAANMFTLLADRIEELEAELAKKK